ncbi:MAG: hypothetical protein AAFX40_11645 [Cyanobacteria bacterium J06639_1]
MANLSVMAIAPQLFLWGRTGRSRGRSLPAAFGYPAEMLAKASLH